MGSGPGGPAEWAGAKCVVPHPDLFFPERGRAQRQVIEAKKVCNGGDGGGICPSREVCLDWSLDTRQRFGVWGGMSERERNRERKRRAAEAARLEKERQERRARRSAASRKAWETRRNNASGSKRKVEVA